MSLGLVACGGGSQTDGVEEEQQVQKHAVFEAPSSIYSSSLDVNSFEAEILVDGKLIPTTVDTSTGQARATLESLGAGTYEIEVIYYYRDEDDRKIPVAQAKKGVVVGENEKGFAFTAEDYELLDTDGVDGNNLTEIEQGTNYNLSEADLPFIELSITAADNASELINESLDEKQVTFKANITDQEGEYSLHEWSIVGHSEITVDVDDVSPQVSNLTFELPYVEESPYELTVEFVAKNSSGIKATVSKIITLYNDDINGESNNPELKAAIARARHRDPADDFSLSDLKNWDNLDLSRENIGHLEFTRWDGIQCFLNLEALSATNQDFSAAGALDSLSLLVNLKYLNIEATGISDINALSPLVNLETLDISNNDGLTSLSPLQFLTKLTYLRYFNGKAENISHLASLVNLETLDIESQFNDGNIQDISALSGLTQLKNLQLRGHKISDISALQNLTQLEDVRFYRNQIEDISPLANSTNMRILVLSTNNISTIQALAGMSELEQLEMVLNEVSDISPLANLTKLKIVNFRLNDISDISPVTQLPSVTDLDVSNNGEFADFTFADGSQLTNLVLANNSIDDLSPFTTLTELESLDLSFQDPALSCDDLTNLANTIGAEITSDGCL